MQEIPIEEAQYMTLFFNQNGNEKGWFEEGCLKWGPKIKNQSMVL